MGLLDDAIREHLDLMRARGGDPAEVERMEREALGPVRREPTIGSARPEAVGEHAPAAHELFAHEDHLADLEDLQERGYHDSTAPHPHNDDHGNADDQFGLGNGGAYAEEPEQPRRRFLRRNRSAQDAAMADRGFGPDETEFDPLDPNGLGDHDPLGHDDPFAQHDALAQDDALAQHDPLGHVESPIEPFAHEEPPFAAHEPLAHDEPLEHPTAQEQAVDPVPPPPLQFESPPKRPRFTAEPPELRDAGAAADAPLPPIEPEADAEIEVQETTEFDVQRHIAETRHQPDEEPPAAPVAPASDAPPVAPEPPAASPPPTAASAPPTTPAPPATSTPPAAPAPSVGELPAEDEDVLEETPEFLQDTPEHDRLWFEQRPPKDFDFDG